MSVAVAQTPNQYLSTRQVRTRYGNVSDMWVWRRLRDSAFPKPTFIAGRRFWRLSDLEAWEAKLDTK
jgi:predicted DNA-binding transcriptional regulator AlpA